MFNSDDVKHKGGRGALALVVVLGIVACLGDVPNLTSPDSARATQNPTDVQAYIGGAFSSSFTSAMNTSLAITVFTYGSAQMTATLAGSQDQQQYQEIMEPRLPLNNNAELSQGVGPHGARNYWAAIGKAQSIAYDGLHLLNGGIVIKEGTAPSVVDVTPRARAFAYFMHGWATGNAAMIFDTVQVVSDTADIPNDPTKVFELALSTLTAYPKAIAYAISDLDSAIAIAQRSPTVVTYPAYPAVTLWFGSPTIITNAQFIGMANTLKARLLILSSRTPAERAAVDWQKVLTWTAAGVTTDFVMQLDANRTSTYLSRLQANTSGGATNARWNYRTIGPADQSGAYQAWIAAPLTSRNRFNIVTPDRRITGTTATAACAAPAPASAACSNGAYTSYRTDNNGFLDFRGTNLFSAYQWTRHQFRNNLTGTNVGNNVGVLPLITVDENNLMRAEALLRTGDKAGAATLISITRTRTQKIGTVTGIANLPAVTAAGVPTVNGQCVPRTDTGACGDLLTALRYERMIELAGTDMIMPQADSRGFGILVDGALTQWPITGNILELYELPPYTYGGVGGKSAAVYAPATLP